MKKSHRCAMQPIAATASSLFASLLLSHAARAQELPPAPPAASAPAAQAPPISAGAPFTTSQPRETKEAVAAAAYPRVGGHLGFALPIVSISSPTTVIGADFVTIGLTPGVTVKLTDHWAVDFEFIARQELKNTPQATTWVVDPGVIYATPSVAGGLRIATVVGDLTNIALVPIVVLPVVKVSDLVTWYIEGDVPAFIFDAGTKVKTSVGFQFQSGFSF